MTEQELKNAQDRLAKQQRALEKKSQELQDYEAELADHAREIQQRELAVKQKEAQKQEAERESLRLDYIFDEVNAKEKAAPVVVHNHSRCDFIRVPVATLSALVMSATGCVGLALIALIAMVLK